MHFFSFQKNRQLGEFKPKSEIQHEHKTKIGNYANFLPKTSKNNANFEQEKRREVGLNPRLIFPCSDCYKICRKKTSKVLFQARTI
jgi:hypothetical protein